jgi:hypothetical protein
MAAIATMDWNDLKRLRCWTPLANVSPSAEALGDRLFRLGPGQYVLAVPYDKDFARSEGAPFVTIVLWSETNGAARRASLMEIEADEWKDVSPPPELLLPDGPTTYGDIARALKTGDHGAFQETASYRIARDGAFVDRTIATPASTFHFRKRQDDPADRCYAIEYRLD